MARSVRVAEQKTAAEVHDGGTLRRRPFLVLMTEAQLTDEIRTVLEGDGLTPVALPSFVSEGIAVPTRQKQRGEKGVVHQEDVEYDEMVEAQEGKQKDSEDAQRAAALAAQTELSWWMKIRLWNLTQYRRIVYLDADILVNRPIDELFALPDKVAFAAPVHVSRDDKGAELSVGIMSLRPDSKTYQALVAFLSEAAPLFETGVRSVDQMLQHSFFARYFVWKGPPRWGDSGNFKACADDMPPLHEGAPQLGGYKPTSELRSDEQLGTVCILPPRYDFCVSYPSLASAMYRRDTQEELASQFAQIGEARVEGAWQYGLKARILHWTGPRRKPWMHWLPLAKTAFDNLWWKMHQDLCSYVKTSEALDGGRLNPQPCSFHCTAW
eukprot:TRINITY_DN10049_c1_g1_i1.p1 TRINITY_DN10049_c1_g1~~TRINITY_DN10049_c1_g1_i1.p1  ORF type:complete len:381 (+),score=84.67 TRINITY_DN10049_c1_g1_i1:174-1316(+)